MTIPSLKTTIPRVLDYLVRTKPQAGVPSFQDEIPFMHLSTLAQAEGWDVFDCGEHEDVSARIEIQRVDSPESGQPIFDADHDAWGHVVARARFGSALHGQN